MKRARTVMLAVPAALVLGLSGCGDGDGGEATDDGANGDDGAGSAESIEVEAGDLYFDPEELSASAGEIEIVLDNVGEAEHDFIVEEAGDTEVAHAQPGETVEGSIELEAGTYTFYCGIPGHRSSMEGTLEVS